MLRGVAGWSDGSQAKKIQIVAKKKALGECIQLGVWWMGCGHQLLLGGQQEGAELSLLFSSQREETSPKDCPFLSRSFSWLTFRAGYVLRLQRQEVQPGRELAPLPGATGADVLHPLQLLRGTSPTRCRGRWWRCCCIGELLWQLLGRLVLVSNLTREAFSSPIGTLG